MEEKPQRTWLETTTTALQALSAIAVPLAVAWIGFLIQQSIPKQTTAKDHVALAIDILKTEPKKDSGGDPLRDWAVDVLTLDSPVPISKSGQVQLRAKRLDIVVLPVDEDSLAKAFAALEKAISAKSNLKIDRTFHFGRSQRDALIPLGADRHQLRLHRGPDVPPLGGVGGIALNRAQNPRAALLLVGSLAS